MFPFIADKPLWPHKPDVQYHENWRVRQDTDPTVDEVIRNFVVRQPFLRILGA